MAAKMKLCRCLSKLFWNFVIIAILGSLYSNIFVESATSAPTNASDSTTDAPTTLAPTQPPTTTLPSTTTTIPSGPRTVIGETVVGQCLCDLTGNKCDINCRCDEDCTEDDLSSFLYDSTSVVIDNSLCYQENFFIFTNPPVEKTTDNGIFCIYFDNYKERNFYLDPDFILDIPSFNQYSYQYGTASLQLPVSTPEPVYDIYSFYTAGEPVYIVYPNEAVGTLVLPVPSNSNQCNDQNTLSYLQEENTECTRVIPTLDQASCLGTAALEAASYYSGFKIVMTTGLFGYVVNGTFIDITTPSTAPPTTVTTEATTADNVTDSTVTTPVPTDPPTTTPPPTSVNVSLIQDLYNNPYVLEIDATSLTHLCMQPDGSLNDCTFQSGTIPSPTFDAASGTCQNVVQEVRYFITTNGKEGISKVQTQFVFRDVTSQNIPYIFTQHYSVAFSSVTDNNNTFARSGNPGYIIGKPVLYGTLNITRAVIELPSDPSEGFTIVRASANGDCSTVSRTPIMFGDNMRSGCIVRLNVSSLTGGQICQNIQTRILQALEGPNSPPNDNRYVATFGNTATAKIGDWVRIMADNRPKDSVGDLTSCWLSMGVHIQILYANVGALALPQAKIIGVAYLYDSVKKVQFQCNGAFCQSSNANAQQAFEVSQTVSFVDVSQPATKFAGEPPIFIARVPNDFFYPFLYYSSGTSLTESHHGLMMLCALIVTFLTNAKYLVS